MGILSKRMRGCKALTHATIISMMKWIAIALAALGALIFLALGAHLVFNGSNTARPVAPAVTPLNPFGFLTGDQGSSGETLSLTLEDGSIAVVPDFTKTEQPAWAGPSAGYQVAGDAITGDFLITYIVPDPKGGQGQFLIALLVEPLGATRLAAEAALRQKLQLSDAALCGLDTLVRVGPGVNNAFGNYELGLSFCPESVTLP